MINRSYAIFGLLLGALVTLGIYEGLISKSFDCVNDYSGYVVVDNQDGKLVLSEDCNYSTVYFPAIYNYAIGDTVGKTPLQIEKLREEVKNLKHKKDSLSYEIPYKEVYLNILNSKIRNGN